MGVIHIRAVFSIVLNLVRLRGSVVQNIKCNTRTVENHRQILKTKMKRNLIQNLGTCRKICMKRLPSIYCHVGTLRVQSCWTNYSISILFSHLFCTQNLRWHVKLLFRGENNHVFEAHIKGLDRQILGLGVRLAPRNFRIEIIEKK